MKQKTAVLTFDDGIVNQYTVAAPILRQYGFNASFYVGQWIAGVYPDAPAHCISREQLLALHQEGFEIGNHTMGHPAASACSTERLHAEIGGIETLFAGIGLPRPQTFAYPGGECSDEAVRVLSERGYLAARTTEPRATAPGSDEPMKTPAFSVSLKSGMEMFDRAMAALTEDHPVVLVYHGMPSVHYPPCGIEPEDFAKQMAFLHAHDIRGISMLQYVQEYLSGDRS